MYVCAPNAFCANRAQKRPLNSLELELHKVFSNHMGVGNRTWFLWKNNQYSELLSYLSAPIYFSLS